MPTTTIEDEISLCSSCLVWVVNRDDSGLDPEDPRPMNLWENDPTVSNILISDAHDDDGEGHCEGHFSWSPCAGCGGLAGTRYDQTIHYDHDVQ